MNGTESRAKLRRRIQRLERALRAYRQLGHYLVNSEKMGDAFIQRALALAERAREAERPQEKP